MTFNKYRLKGAYHYEWYETEAWYKECVDECVKFCQGSTLDVGCGDGFLTKKISENYKATGIDPDADGIRVARQHFNGDFRQEAAGNMRAGTWEYMASLNVIEHMDNPEELKFILRHYITKGAIIITNQYLGGSLGEDHRREYDYKELLDFFKEFKPKGFRLCDGEYIGVKIKL